MAAAAARLHEVERARLVGRHDLAVGADTLLAVLDDIGRCVAMTPARELVFFNGHGGNSRCWAWPTASSACATG